MSVAEENRIAFSSLILSDNFNTILGNLFEVSNSQILTLELVRKVIQVRPELVVTPNFLVNLLNHLNRENRDSAEFYPLIRFFNELIDNDVVVIPMLIDSDVYVKALDLVGQFDIIEFLSEVNGEQKNDLNLIYLILAKLANKLLTYKSTKLYFKRYIIEVLNENFIMVLNKFTQYFFSKRTNLLFMERYHEMTPKDSATVDIVIRSLWVELDGLFSGNIYSVNGLYINMLIVRAIQLFDKCNSSFNDRLYNAYLKRTDQLTIKYKAEQLDEDMNWEKIEVPFISSFTTIKKEVE